MTAFVLGTMCLVTLAVGVHAGSLGAPPALDRAPRVDRQILADWQDPALLPRQFYNNCAIENWSGRPYCSDHCGRGYQFYYCTRESFGCCTIGYGYCDLRGHLRCHP